MSGPKAFRIVTRAEIISICRRSLARLDAAVEFWTSTCKRNGTIDQSDIDRVVARRDEIRRMLDADRFTDLQKQVIAEISYLSADAERRAEKAAESEAKRKGDQRRAKSAAQALLAKFEASHIEIPIDLRRELTTAAASVESLNKAVSKGLMLLQPTDRSEGVTERQRALADRLGAGDRRITLEEWTSQQTGASDDQALLKVDKLLGELDGLGIDPSPFSARIAALEAEPRARQALVADSLLLDLNSAIKTGRGRARLERDLAERHAELSEMKSAEATALRVEIERAIAKAGSNDQELVKRADFLIEAEVRSIAAEERRRAVLEGLSSLGYEVSEGMMTAWVSGGRIVLRKPANPGYGVELSGGSQADLMQVRAVGIGNPAEARDAGRDRDMETIWCGEFERLQSLVAKAGGNVSLESARPVGQYPLKVVEDLAARPADVDVAATRHHSRQ
ncbi:MULTISPECIES: hypothetical protein [unclassified Bradyrhizobium]|uniref:hypothetical protein n=1 Tax=unclassified Bradyrhizobium TaxID=2631580 RepID=UPI001FF94375|nr:MULTISPECIES: hypothetical protein [unclassified Bradyrhizobium]MCK1298437.1 hypothetical protein [Bradyrhizobium sp. 37]MCK1769480.1 hypothetical protein [Bradyrhizobium sp. 134]